MKKIYQLALGGLFIGLSCNMASAEGSQSMLSLTGNNRVKLADVKKQSTSSEVKKIATRADEAPITEPTGEGTLYKADGQGWMNYMGILTMQVQFTTLNEIYMDGTDVYIKNPISQFATDTYMKGTLNGDKIVCTFPQLIYQEEGSNYYATRLDGVEEPNDWGTTTWVYSMPEENNEIVYTLEDGKWVMEGEGFGMILGMVDEEWDWVGFGDCDVVYAEFNETAIEAPEGLETEEWVFVADGGGHKVNVGFVDNEVYIQGISVYIPDAWVKGEVKENSIVFEGGQYMGSYDSPGGFYLAFLVGGEEYMTGEGSVNYYILPEIEFEYDAEAKSMSFDNTLFVNSNPDYIRYLEIFNYPVIHFQPAEFDMTPAPVELTLYQEWNGEYMAAQFILPNLTAEGYILDTENLYWRLFLDEELYEFDEEMYGEIPENQTEVPYYYSESWEIYGQGAQKTFFLYTEGFDVLSIQVVYKDGQKSYYSDNMNYNIITGDISYSSGTSSVESIGDSSLVKVEYYNLNGQKIANPDNGIYIKRAHYSDGSVKATKVIRR